MGDKEKQINEGYSPETIEKGYQPAKPDSTTTKPDGGYVPAGTGDNPANVPVPPGDE